MPHDPARPASDRFLGPELICSQCGSRSGDYHCMHWGVLEQCWLPCPAASPSIPAAGYVPAQALTDAQARIAQLANKITNLEIERYSYRERAWQAEVQAASPIYIHTGNPPADYAKLMIENTRLQKRLLDQYDTIVTHRREKDELLEKLKTRGQRLEEVLAQLSAIISAKDKS